MLKFLFIFLSFSIFAQEQKYLYSNLVLGERDIENYSGPRDPTLKKGSIGQPDIFADDFFKGHYLEEFGQADFFDLLEFVGNDLSKKSVCSNHYLNKNIPRMRYLFRLLTISYVFETLKELKITSYNLGFGDICSLSWEDTFKQCRAKGIEMANFIKRIKGHHLKDFSNTDLVKMKHQERDKWLNDFHSKAENYKELDLSQSRILYFCQENGIDCQTIDFENLKFAFQLSCSEDQYMLLNLCSNRDRLYGLSNVREAYKLLVDSNSFKDLNNEGYGAACLKRFRKDFRNKEKRSPLLQFIFPKVLELMIREKRIYRQGSLFIYGSLKEFEKKGLEGFLFPHDSEDKEVEITKKGKEIEKVKKKLKIEPSLKPHEIPTLKGFLELIEEIKKVSGIDIGKVKQLKSKIVEAEVRRFMSDSPREPVDMVEFKKEFVFKKKLSEEILDRINLYQEKETLLNLKNEDQLGLVSQPFPLSFLKYLIDINDEGSLYTIVGIYGKTLFVINDLEKPSKVFPIELKKELDHWQIFILRQELEGDAKPKFKGN